MGRKPKEQKVEIPKPGIQEPVIGDPVKTKTEINTIVSQAENKKLDEPIPGVKKERKPYTKRAVLEQQTEEQRLADQATARLTGTIIVKLFDFAALRMPNPIPTSQEEAETLQQAIEAEMMKALPAITKWKEEMNLVGAVGVWILPRLKKQKKEPLHVVTSEPKPDAKS